MLTLENLSKSYGDKQALKGINLSLSEGIYGLLGPNGSGKSTLMNLITDNLMPTAGKVLWEGQEIRSLKAEYRKLIGYAPQQQGLYDSFSGRRFLSYMAALKGISKKEMKGEIERVLEFVNLQEAEKRPIGAYSGGMKQRILIAQAILGNPKLIVLDEPTAGLDPKERVNVREKIRLLSKERIILVSTHVVSDIESIATEILVLKAGELVLKGTVESLCDMCHAGNLEDVYMQIFGEAEHCINS